MKNEYGFDPIEVIDKIKNDMKAYVADKGGKVVLGISGGKDSLICAKLAADALGTENVIGVTMPNGVQGDFSDALDAIHLTGISSYAINIKDAFDSLNNQLQLNGLKPSQDTIINLPPRLRMSVLYAVSQTTGGIVLCTDNLLERHLGYFTIYGDGAGGYAPLRDLTVQEVIDVGLALGLPERLVCKKPGDGLQSLGDEERMGISYFELGRFVRYGEGTDEFKTKIINRYQRNKFKTDIVDIPGPMFGFPDYVLNN